MAGAGLRHCLGQEENLAPAPWAGHRPTRFSRAPPSKFRHKYTAIKTTLASPFRDPDSLINVLYAVLIRFITTVSTSLPIDNKFIVHTII